MFKWLLLSALLGAFLFTGKNNFSPSGVYLSQCLSPGTCKAEDETEPATPLPPKVDNDIGKHADGSKTDDEVVQK